MALIDYEEGTTWPHPQPGQDDPRDPRNRDEPSGGGNGGGGGGSSAPVDPLANYSGRERDFLERNRNPDGSYDIHRLASAFADDNKPKGQAFPKPMAGPMPQSAWGNVFSDPLTKQYEALLQAQLGLYQQQQQAMQEAAASAQSRRAQTADAVKRLEEFVNQRVGKLQGPAYTGTEQEVLRTQFLDPMERDRSAAQKRAYEQISARGLTPESGISQELLRMVDQEFNQYRAQGQGAIATRQIEEQRSREQEAQELLKYLAQLPDAVARGDLEFVNFVQTMINQPGQQGLTVGKLLADLPSERLNDALATLGVAPSGGNTSAQMLQLLAQQQQQRQYQQALNANAWGSIGKGFF